MSDQRDVRFYGRRKGHDLRPARQRLIDEALPFLRLPDALPTDLSALFPRPVTQVWLEIGFGGGEHLVHQAKTHPEIGLIGIEPFLNGIAACLAEIEREGIDTIRLYDDDARLILDQFPPASLSRVFILFPDPWPKTRHNKRRIVQPAILDGLARIMAPGAELRFASDHLGYVRWALFHICRHPAFAWTAQRPSDWRQRWADAIPTRYEQKGLASDTPAYLSFRRR